MDKINPIQLALIDDHQIVIDGLKSLLRKEVGIEVVGEALNAYDALSLLEKKEIGVMITDFNMPGMSGLDLCKQVKSQYPHIKVLVLTMHDDPEIVNEIFLSEAEGFLLKNTGRKELCQAIYKLADGGTYYSRAVLDILMQKQQRQSAGIEHTQKAKLTPRETEILQLISGEHTTAEIAEKLFISPRTVDTHRKNLLQKTQCRSVVGLVRYALSIGLV